MRDLLTSKNRSTETVTLLGLDLERFERRAIVLFQRTDPVLASCLDLTFLDFEEVSIYTLIVWDASACLYWKVGQAQQFSIHTLNVRGEHFTDLASAWKAFHACNSQPSLSSLPGILRK